MKIITVIIAALMLQGCIAAAVVGIAGGITVATDNRSIGNQIDDQKIELEAHNLLAKQESIDDNTHLQVISMNGSVLVIGQALNTHLRDLAITSIKTVPGVVQIHDQIRISNLTSIATRSNDLWITSKVKAALIASKGLDDLNVKVVTENGEVFLLGVLSEQQANQAVEVARNVSGVNRVFKMFEISKS